MAINVTGNIANIAVNTTSNVVTVSSSPVNVQLSATSVVSNASVRQAISVSNLSGYGNLTYDSSNISNGVIQYTGVANSDITTVITDNPSVTRAALSATSPVTYNQITGVFSLEQTLDDLTLKKYQETVVDNGTATGNVSVDIANGTIQKFTLTGDITGITINNIDDGGSATILLNQDSLGGNSLDTTTHASNWTAWDFVNDFSSLSTTGSAFNILNVLRVGSVYYASLSNDTQINPASLDVTGNITAGGNISGTYIIGDGSQLTNIPGHLTNAEVKTFIEANGLDASANITTTANVSGAYILGDGSALTNIPTLTNAQVKTYLESTGLTSTANITGSNVIGTYLYGDGSNISGLPQGDITAVTAGTGLTGGGTVGDVQLNVGAGTGITANANDIAVDMSAFDTDDLSEGGTNLYFTDARVETAADGLYVKISADNFMTGSGTLTNTVIFSEPFSGAPKNLRLAGNTDIIGISTNDTVGLQFVANASANFGANSNINLSSTTYVQGSGIINTSGNITGGNVEATTNVNTQTLVATGNIDGANINATYFHGDGSNITGIAGDIESVVAGSGLTGGGTSGDVTLDVGAGTGITVNADNVAVNMGDFTTSDLAEGTNLYFTNTAARSALSTTTASASGGGALAYDNGTGVFTFTPADLSAFNISGNITTTANIQGNYIIADTQFEGDINGAVLLRCFNNTATTIAKGNVVYLTGENSGDQPYVDNARADSASTMPVAGIAKEPITASSSGEIVTLGELTGLDLTGFTTGDVLYVSTSTAGAFQNTAPTSEAHLIQNIGKVVNGGTGGALEFTGAGRVNATPNLDEGNIFLGSSSNTAITVTPDSNFDTTGNAFSLSNTLTDVNSIASETGADITLKGQANGIHIDKTINSVQSTIVDVDTDGYTVTSGDFGTGTVTGEDVPGLMLNLDNTTGIVAGSNTFTVKALWFNPNFAMAGVQSAETTYTTRYLSGTLASGSYPSPVNLETAMNNGYVYVNAGAPTFVSNLVNTIDPNLEGWKIATTTDSSITAIYPANAYVTGISGNVVTMSENAVNSVAANTLLIATPMGISSTQDIQFKLEGDTANFNLPYTEASPLGQYYNNPETISNTTIDIMSYGSATETLSNSTTRHIADLDVGNGSAVRINQGLLIGERATPDIFSGGTTTTSEASILGLTLENSGLKTYASDDLMPQTKFLINQYTDNSPATATNVPNWVVGATGNTTEDLLNLGAPAFNFKLLNGNKDDRGNLQLTANAVIGKIQWNGIALSTSGSDVVYPPAAVTVRVPTDQTQTSPVMATDFYQQATYRTSYRNGTTNTDGGIPRTFLASKAGNTVIAAKTDGRIALKPVRDYGDAGDSTSFIENRYPQELHEYHTFLDAKFASGKTGTLITIQPQSGETGGSTDFNYDSKGNATLRFQTHNANNSDRYNFDLVHDEANEKFIIESGLSNQQHIEIEQGGRVSMKQVMRLHPQTSAEILALTGNTTGDMVYNSTDNLVAYYDGTNWRNIAQGAIIT